MLRKLRIKTIIVIMLIVTIMLSLIFSLMYISISRNLEMESIQTMRSIALNPLGGLPPGEKSDNNSIPYFSVHINSFGEIIKTGGGFFGVNDYERISDILDEAIASAADVGIIEDYGLRFIREEIRHEVIFVFGDISREQSVLHNLIKYFIISGIIAFIIFLGISILFAKWAVKPVEVAWNQQKQFVADASHELKTPLTVIMADADLLNSPDSTEEERKQLSGSILTMSVQMRGLVESLLELARMDNGNVKAIKESVQLSDVMSNAAMTFEPIFFEKDMPFSYEIEPDINTTGNPTKLKQLADILLDNASKYASPGGNTIMTLKRISQKKCLLEVKNLGEPIADEDMKNLFKRFYRADKARTINHSYGLGLSIAESIVKDHNGRIWAQSHDGYNSFYAELPAK